MATLAELETALRNADAAGATDDARRLAEAIVAARGQQQAKPQELSAQTPTPTMADRNRQAIAVGGPLAQYAPDILMGLRTPIDAGAQMLTRGLSAVAPAGSGLERWAQEQARNVENVNAKARAAYEQTYGTGGVAGSVGRGIGESLVGGPLLSKVAPAATVVGRTLQGAGVGAGMGLLTPVQQPADNFWEQKGVQAGTGAAIGAATGPAAELVGRVFSPKTNPNVQALMKEGITPTPGEILGGAAKRIEEGIVSVPLLGDVVKTAQRRSIEQFNRAMYERSLAPLGNAAAGIAKKAPVGNEGVRIVGDTLSNAYESALARSVPNVMIPGSGNSQAVNSAATGFVSAIRQTQSMVPRAQRDDFVDAMNNHVFSKITPSGTLTPSAAKEAESELGRMAFDYMKSSDASQRQLGRAFRQAQEELRTVIAANNPSIAPEIQAINQGWRTLAQIEKAGAKQGAKEGVFTPAQFMSAVREGSSGQRKRQFARGEAWNQELGKAAEGVLSSRLPDSGTILRGMIAGTMLGGGTHLVNPVAGLVGSSLVAPYTPLGQKAVAAMLTKRPDLLRRFGTTLGESAPYLAAPITGGLLGQY